MPIPDKQTKESAPKPSEAMPEKEIKVEKISLPEVKPEVAPAITKEAEAEKAGPIEKVRERIGAVKPSAPPTTEEKETEAKIEKILEEDLEDTYFNLPEGQKKEFKESGEQTAWKITDIIYHKPKFFIIRIVNLIRGWLKKIPGVNKFFVEQETKIKAEKIIELKKK